MGYTLAMPWEKERALARKVMVGFEAAEKRQREFTRREGPRLEWAVEVSSEVDAARISATLAAFDEPLVTDRSNEWLRLREKNR